jgi:rifampicin phosphotransferase
MKEARFGQDPAYRRERLAALRERFQQGRMSEPLRAELLRRVHARFRYKGLFVRSSTNSEDLPGFNGAGLYTTVPNARGDDQIAHAIKTVWASVWNFAAYEARERAGIAHLKVYMAVLLQEGINADSAGVMITTDPYDPENRNAISISAKRGLGIKVVEGEKVAEQILFNPQTNAVRVLTRSAEDSLLQFDERGGIREVPIGGERAVLTGDVARRLAHAAARIKRVFRDKDQDIEWAYRRAQIYIVQSRPYIAGG